MGNELSSVCSSLKQSADDARASFGGLSAEQLNWKAAQKTWSVAQCLDHVIVTNSLYLPLFEKLRTGEFKDTFWQRISPLSGYFGRYLIKSIDPANVKPMKTTSRAFPASSAIDAGIVDRYTAHQQEMVDALRKLPADLDTSMILTSPLMGLVTYSLADALTFTPMHCERHINQAKRVMAEPGFPS